MICRDLLIDESRFWGVFLIDVSTTDLAERCFLDVAQKLFIPAQTWEDARLGIANLKHPWLLVLDNADDSDVDYQDYFPGETFGVVMLTSRNDECQQYATAKSITLEGLCEGEARELLLKAARVPHDQYGVHGEDAKMVASLLQCHPIALIQAGAYVSRGHCTLADYPRASDSASGCLHFDPAKPNHAIEMYTPRSRYQPTSSRRQGPKRLEMLCSCCHFWRCVGPADFLWPCLRQDGRVPRACRQIWTMMLRMMMYYHC
jgi:hypothetical protein